MYTKRSSSSLQLNLFKDSLPSHGFATDDYSQGIRYCQVSEAVKRAIIQYNYKNSVKWLVYDIDASNAALQWEDRDAPAPNIIAINKDNGHGHYFYGLEVPVHNNPGSSEKALRYLAAVDIGLTAKLGADPGYSKLLSKNPIHDRWITLLPYSYSYTLDELADWVELENYQDRRRRLDTVGYGRNCTLFERLRLWAYKARREPFLSEQMFHDAVRHRALVLNGEFETPLPHSEVRATAKSVAKWTWRRMSREGFSAYQSARGKRSGEVRKAKATERQRSVLQAIQECPDLTQADIAAMFDLHRTTVNRYLSAIRKDVARTISDSSPVAVPDDEVSLF